MKKYMKENKILVIIIVLFFLLVIASFFVKAIFFSGANDALYGDRLDGMKKVEISSSQKKRITSKLEEDSAVSSAKYSLQGKIINLIVVVNDDVGLDTAKSLSGKVLEELDDSQKQFYDIQLFIKKNNEAGDFPIIGYKQNKKNDFVWTKDRAAS